MAKSKKVYTFSIKESKVSRTYGGANETADIYRMKNNKPEYVGEVSWCTRGYKGDTHEVYGALRKKNLVSEKEYKSNGGYYRKDKSNVEIFSM